MRLRRRDLLAGLGVVATGGAVFGTIAQTQTEVTRKFDIGVAADDTGQLELAPTGTTDAVTLKTVGNDGLEVLSLDFEKLNTQSDTDFGGAFTITNGSALDEPMWIHAPRALDANDDGVSDAVQESVEFLIDSDDSAVLDTQVSNPGGMVDFSLPPAYPSEFSANPGNPDATGSSSMGKVTDTGAFRLANGGSVTVTIRVLDFPLDPNDSEQYLFRLVADRQDSPAFPEDWDADPAVSIDGGGGQ